MNISSALIKTIGNIHWPISTSKVLNLDDMERVRKRLTKDYYIILTRRANHMSTYMTSVATKYLTGKFGYYAHALMNLEDDVTRDEDFRLVEAISTGVRYSTFGQALGDLSAVCLLKPRRTSIEEWTLAMDKVKTQVGKPYDTLFDLSNDQALSCVELVEVGLHNLPNYKSTFAQFDSNIARAKNLVPQMFRDCSDFEVGLEIRK